MDTLHATKVLDPASRTTCAELIDQCGDSVYKLCRTLTRNRQDADDLFQDTFMKAFEQLDKLSASNNRQGFLLYIASHLWKSRKRKTARRMRLAPETQLFDTVPSDNSPEGDYLQQEEERAVRTAVAALPDKLKVPVCLYYELEMSIQDIAHTLRLPQGTVKSRLHKARQKIKNELEGAQNERS